MKTLSEFELEEYDKMISSLRLSDEDADEDKSRFFNAWSFGHSDGDYIATSMLPFSAD